MRVLSAVLLFCVLALGMSGSLRASEITVPNAQLLIDAARTAPVGVFTDVKLIINGTEVVFTLFRDSVGNVTAKPKIGQVITPAITTTQVNIQMGTSSTGLLTPISMVVQGGGNDPVKYVVNFTSGTNTVSTLTTPTGGIGGNSGGNSGGTTPDPFANPFLIVSAGGQLPLPAGAESGKISVWQP